MPATHPKTQDQKIHKPTQQKTQQQQSRQTQGATKQNSASPKGSMTHFDQELPETRMFR